MIKISISKAKQIAHKLRREVRQKEFQPFDEIISKQIPDLSSRNAEKERKKIREKYKVIQDQIDSCSDCTELKKMMQKMESGDIDVSIPQKSIFNIFNKS